MKVFYLLLVSLLVNSIISADYPKNNPGEDCSEDNDCENHICKDVKDYDDLNAIIGTCCRPDVDPHCVRCFSTTGLPNRANKLKIPKKYRIPGICIVCKKGYKLKNGRCIKK
jgi:hypothetical protein